MEEEDEDKLLLSSLGITSANPEDIERRVLSKVITDVQCDSEYDKGANDQKLKEKSENNPSSHNKTDLYNKLRALQVEIDAVASTVDKDKAVATNGDDSLDDAEENEKVKNGIALQQALAKDRLKSLKQTRAQLLKEISSNTEMSNEALLNKLVEETSNKRKLKSKAVDNSKKGAKSRRKTVSYSDDTDFDAVLDAATAGFVETERDQLVRKGILTPFHKLKGFERSIQEPESSTGHNGVDEGMNEHLASSSISRAAQSMSNFAKARPTTKLLDPLELPALEPPTRSFHRVKVPAKRKCKKMKRPLPDKRYRKEELNTGKRASLEDWAET